MALRNCRFSSSFFPVTIITVISFFFSPPVVSAAPAWTRDACRFTGESDAVRRAAIRNLRARKNLQSELRQALEATASAEERFLALDVISTLRLRELIPDLIRFTEKDRSGYGYHALNAILAPKDVPELARLYHQRLQLIFARKEEEIPLVAVPVTLLDSLGRMNVELDPAEVGRYFKAEEPEVRSAVLY